MLVLTRHLNEAIRIGDGVIIKILGIDSNNVKIGIEAPKNILVYREEIYTRIKEENLNASKVDYADVKGAAERIKEKVKDKVSQNNYALFVMDNDKNKNIILEVFLENDVPIVLFDLRKDERLDLKSFPTLVVLNISNDTNFDLFCKNLNISGIKTSVLALNVPSSIRFDENIYKKICFSADFSDWEQIRIQITNMLKLKIYPLDIMKSSITLNNFPFSISRNSN
jgi:carbon storage regulator